MVDRVGGSIVSVLVRDPCRCFAVKNRRRGCFVGRFVGRIREEIRAVQREEQQHQQQHKEPRQGAFINVPVNCPPDKVKVGNRCRAFF